MRVLALGGLLTLLISNLASAAIEYPRREIDRPYLIPGHLSELRVGLGVTFSTGSSPSPGLVPTLEFESGHSENFAWLFSPIPIGFKFQVLHNDHHRLGLRAHYQGFAYGTALNYRFRFANQAIEIEGVLDGLNLFVIKTRTQELVIRPMFQVSDDFVMIVSGSYGRYSYGVDFLSVLFADFGRDPRHSDFVSTQGLSAGLDLQFPFNDQIDLRVGVKALHFYEGNATADAVNSNLLVRARW